MNVNFHLKVEFAIHLKVGIQMNVDFYLKVEFAIHLKVKL